MNAFELRIGSAHQRALWEHLHRPDHDEYGAIALAGVREQNSQITLYVRELHLADEDEFVPAPRGYRQFAPLLVAEMGGRAAEEELAYVAIHSHPRSRYWTRLSSEDLHSHRVLFPHLLDLTKGMPVAGVAVGTNCAAGELWKSESEPIPLRSMKVVGPRLNTMTPGEVPLKASISGSLADERDVSSDQVSTKARSRSSAVVNPKALRFDRQVRLLGEAGQEALASMHVGVVGAGGGGSILIQQLAHLGVDHITVVDYDVVKAHNLSRIVGAVPNDAIKEIKKVEVMRRLVALIDPKVELTAIDGDIADLPIAEHLLDLDFIFLATDTATSRLVFNAIVHRYLIPGLLIGAKVEVDGGGAISQIYIAVRPVLPDHGCLQCNGLINAMQLQEEARGEGEIAAQNYLGSPDIIDPSVITLNGIGASHGANTMLMQVVGLYEVDQLNHQLFFPLENEVLSIEPLKDPDCPFCGLSIGSAFGAGGPSLGLPCRRSSSS